jgi:hypothetical protein
MKRFLEYYMWGYQQHFQHNAQNLAEQVFQRLSIKLKPTVFLLGILRKSVEGYHPICIEPEECGIEVDSFKDIDKLASEIHDVDPHKKLLHTDVHHHKRFQEDLKIICLQKAVKRLVDKNFEGNEKVSFVSYPVMLDNYEIFIILQFDENVYNKFYLLNREEVKNHELRTAKVRKSLIEALVRVYLNETKDSLYKPRPGVYFDEIKTDIKEIHRIAAKNFVGTTIPSASNSSGTYDLFDICNYISSLKYEGNSTIGKLIICKEDHPNINILLRLTNPIQLRDHRKVRKLLEIASDNLHLCTNRDQIIGFAELKGQYNSSDENLFIVNFTGPHKWELIHDSQIIMIVEYTNPRLPILKIDKSIFYSTLKRIFIEISNDNLDLLWNVVISATEQKHGTLIIISNNARNEVKRLENQSTNIEPLLLDEKIIKSITSIDGAVILDTCCICHAIGVILDGLASSNGTSARGARYNSAIRYVDGHEGECAAIIISEDGMVDLYPQLKPQIKKSESKEYLAQLRYEVGLDKVDYDKFRPIMNWFNGHEFYLSGELCNEINELKKEFYSKLNMEGGAFYIKYRDYKPNFEMNDSYFFEE